MGPGAETRSLSPDSCPGSSRTKEGVPRSRQQHWDHIQMFLGCPVLFSVWCPCCDWSSSPGTNCLVFPCGASNCLWGQLLGPQVSQGPLVCWTDPAALLPRWLVFSFGRRMFTCGALTARHPNWPGGCGTCGEPSTKAATASVGGLAFGLWVKKSLQKPRAHLSRPHPEICLVLVKQWDVRAENSPRDEGPSPQRPLTVPSVLAPGRPKGPKMPH